MVLIMKTFIVTMTVTLKIDTTSKEEALESAGLVLPRCLTLVATGAELSENQNKD